MLLQLTTPGRVGLTDAAVDNLPVDQPQFGEEKAEGHRYYKRASARTASGRQIRCYGTESYASAHCWRIDWQRAACSGCPLP